MVRLTFAVAAACLATVAMVEVGTRGLVGTEVIDLARPHSDDELYWRSDHPTFGVWHAPNASWVHRSKCFKVKYTSNSVGARDIERSRRACGGCVEWGGGVAAGGRARAAGRGGAGGRGGGCGARAGGGGGRARAGGRTAGRGAARGGAPRRSGRSVSAGHAC